MTKTTEQLFRLSIACNCVIDAAGATEKGLIDYLMKTEASIDPKINSESNFKYYE